LIVTTESQGFMFDVKKIAAGTVIAGSLGFAAFGLGTAAASAAPSPVTSGTGWALDPGWGHGPGWDNGPGRNNGPGWGGGPRWAPPPPPRYGYGGYNGGCVTGPLGLLHYCN
jgi:hypothetical protein